ncbi:MAG: hypothetical protein LBS33_08285 [Streptococcaceae bacterium]|nr:hypothetical protein [Streptococcaceae bacterium]
MPYFGTLPDMFDLWLYSVSLNPTIDFLLMTDVNLEKYNVPSNLHVTHTTFQKMQERVKKHFGETAKLERPYKLCDYRPSYGELFKEELTEYEFFGWCDTDMILGDLRSFLTSELLSSTDKIGEGGMFVLIRNQEPFISFYRQSNLATTGVNYKETFFSKYHKGFDEGDFMNRVWDEVFRPHNELFNLVGDTRPRYFDYTTYRSYDGGKELYRYEKGKVYRISERRGKEEMMWVHFLWRSMTKETGLNQDDFWCTPDSFVTTSDSNFFENYVPDEKAVKVFEQRKRRKKIKRLLSLFSTGQLYFKCRTRFRRWKLKIVRNV